LETGMADPRTLQELRQDIAGHGRVAAIIAYRTEDQETWSFAQLDEISTQVARGLVSRGVACGDSVALIAPNSPRWIGAFWGIVAAGAVAVPLDAMSSDRDLAHMLETTACRVVFTTDKTAQRLRAIAPSCRAVILDRETVAAPAETWQDFLTAPDVRFPSNTPNDVAVIVFTSGTTGTPKAVPLTHANLLTNVRALAATGLVGRSDRVLLPLPLHHAYPLTIGMLTPLALGCGIVLPAGISGPELVASMRRGAATALLGVPRLYTALLENVHRGMAMQFRPLAAATSILLAVSRHGHRHGMSWVGRTLLWPLRRKLAPDLRLLVSGGAPIRAEVEEELGAMGWQMLTGYGLVETSSMLTFNPPGGALTGSAGRPVPGMELRIAHRGDDGNGEIETRGPSVFAGYRGDPVKTQEAFTADGWFRTGDLGSIDGKGYLHIAARKSETIVLADGKKLFPEEFEAIYATTPLVREIAILGRDGVLVALVVPDLAAARDFGALRLGDTIREGLAAKARTLPSHARLTGFAVAREALPRTQLGKIRRHLLLPLYEAAQRHEAAPAQGDLSADDRALVETPAAAAIWRWLQQRFPDRNLQLDTVPQIDLAIDSLGWVEITLALERELGIVLKESEIARVVTLRDLLREAATAPKANKGLAVESAETPWLEPLGPALGAIRVLGEVLLRLIMRWMFQLRVEGREFLPHTDPVLICANHASYLDPFALGAALPPERLRHTCWGGWTGVAFTTRLRRLFSRAARVIPVDPDRAAASGLAISAMTLKRGWNLVWFPEGARSLDGRLQRFLPGVGALIERHPVPIVPVYIEGSHAAWPVGQKFPRRHTITVRFGRPIDPVPLLEKAFERPRDEEIAGAIRDHVAALAK
jgi:long-chain acyl-CoA synthetase